MAKSKQGLVASSWASQDLIWNRYGKCPLSIAIHGGDPHCGLHHFVLALANPPDVHSGLAQVLHFPFAEAKEVPHIILIKVAMSGKFADIVKNAVEIANFPVTGTGPEPLFPDNTQVRCRMSQITVASRGRS